MVDPRSMAAHQDSGSMVRTGDPWPGSLDWSNPAKLAAAGKFTGLAAANCQKISATVGLYLLTVDKVKVGRGSSILSWPSR